MKKFTFPMLLATAMVAASCSSDDVALDNNHRNPENAIALSSEDSKIMSRAGFTGGDTKIGVLFASTDGTNSKYSKTEASGAQDTKGGAEDYSEVSFTDGNKRYWDDCFGRDAKLSVYAVAVPNKKTVTLPIVAAAGWTDGAATTTFSWNVPTNQSSTNIDELDLAYSNNIQETSWAKKGIYKYKWGTSEGYYMKTETEYGTESEGRMTFQEKEDGSEAGKFNRGHLIFKHSLCWVTINLVEGAGAGFDNASTEDFKFPTSGANATLVGANQAGNFNLASGSWTGVTSADIAGLKDNSATKTAKTTFTLEAMTLPGKVLDEVVTDFVTFTIDDNFYHVSCEDIAEAIKAKAADLADGELKTRLTSFTTMTAGDHYTITINVGKKAIETVSAEVVQWEKVDAEYNASNDHISFTLRDDANGINLGDGDAGKFQIYRALDGTALSAIPADENAYASYEWDVAFTENTAPTYVSGNTFKTDWFWPSNASFYHFRTVNPATTTSLDSGNKTFTMTSGAQVDAKDYQWGAPYYSNASQNLYYDTNKGYEFYKDGTTRQLFKAIGPTRSDIHMLIQHMMSDVNVVLSTTTDGSAVDLTGAEVTLLYFSETGTVNMGNGLVTPTTTTGAIDYTAAMTSAGDNKFTYRVVPQALKRGTGDKQMVGIRIKTSDNNQYYLVADLSTLKVNAVTNNGNNRYSKDDVIDRWYPGYSYTYNIKLKKTGIEVVTAEIVNWESVTAAEKDVTLESKKSRR